MVMVTIGFCTRGNLISEDDKQTWSLQGYDRSIEKETHWLQIGKTTMMI